MNRAVTASCLFACAFQFTISMNVFAENTNKSSLSSVEGLSVVEPQSASIVDTAEDTKSQIPKKDQNDEKSNKELSGGEVTAQMAMDPGDGGGTSREGANKSEM